MEIEELKSRIKEMNIVDIVQTRIELVQHGGTYMAICPFHNDSSIGSFVVTPPPKNIFKCFSCGVGGDAIRFIAEYDGVNYYEAIVRIAINFKMITQEEGEKLLKRKISKQELYTLENLYNDLEKDDNGKKTLDIDKLNYVYHYFKLGNSLISKDNKRLTDKHYQYLKDRGITDEEIERYEYFSMPNTKIMPIMEHIAKNANINFTNVPGFFFNNDTKKVSFQSIQGIGIPIRNAIGKIVGIQVRKDDVPANSKGSRYTWFTSSFATKKEGSNLSAGTSPGAPLAVVLPEKVKVYQEVSDYKCQKTLFITEGFFKAAKLATTYNAVAISLQGVGNWKGIHTAVNDISKRYQNRIKNIYIAFDADMVYNIQVFKNALKMYSYLKKLYKNIYNFSFVIWDVNYGKGIDDVIDNKNNKHIKPMEAEAFIDMYLNFIKQMIVKEGKCSIDDARKINQYSLFEQGSSLNKMLKDISDTTMELYYQKYVLGKIQE